VRRNLTAWLLRGLAVVVLTTVVALWVLVQPLSEPPHPTPTLVLSKVEGPVLSEESTLTPVLSKVAGPTTTFPPTPSSTPTATPTPTPACTETTGSVEQQVYYSPIAGGEEPYRIYRPPCYDQTDHRYPVLYLLHGWPYEAAHWDGLGVEEAADAGIKDGTLPPFIIVQPQGFERLYINTSGGDHSFEGQVLNDLIPHVEATYRTQTEREGRAIGGISRGGVWALEIGFRNPDVFAAVGAHSPALSVNLAPPVYDPFHLLTDPDIPTLRIYLDAGDADWALESTQALHEALDEQGIFHELVVHPGGHAAGTWSANVAEYLAFYTAGWSASDAPP